MRAAQPNAFEKRNDRRRPARKLAEGVALAILHRLRAIDAARGEMLHQADEKGQVGGGNAFFVERQDEIAALGVQQIIGVLDALGNALEGHHGAEIVAHEKFFEFLLVDMGIDGHESLTRLHKSMFPTCVCFMPISGKPEIGARGPVAAAGAIGVAKPHLAREEVVAGKPLARKQAVLDMRAGSRSRRRRGYGRRRRRARRARARACRRWQSSGSRSAHISAMRWRALSATTRFSPCAQAFRR